MKWSIVLAVLLTLLATAAFAQSGNNTAVGIGTGISASRSTATSNAVAVGGGNATGGTGIGVGTGGGGGSATINNNQVTPAVTTATINNTGTSTVRNVPSVFSPGLAAAGIETCLGSVSGGGSWIGTGFSFGSTIPDPSCAARLDARTLWAFGLKRAALARLCLQVDIYRSMPEICAQYLPNPNGYVAQQPIAVRAYASADTGGAIMLVEGKTGREHLCNDYDAAGQLCRQWADGTPVEHKAKRRVAHANAPKATPTRLKADPPSPEAPKTADIGVGFKQENKSESQPQ